MKPDKNTFYAGSMTDGRSFVIISHICFNENSIVGRRKFQEYLATYNLTATIDWMSEFSLFSHARQAAAAVSLQAPIIISDIMGTSEVYSDGQEVPEKLTLAKGPNKERAISSYHRAAASGVSKRAR